MFNVLTDTFKADIMRAYRTRRLVVWFSAVCVVQVSFLIFLIPSYMSLLFKEKSLQVNQNQTTLTDSNVASSTSISLVQNTQAVLSVLASHVPQGSISALIAHVVSLKDSQISFREISTDDQTASTSEVTVDGVANTREALLAFVQRLQADSVFSNVVLPVSSFAKDSDISFSITMNGSLQSL